jgi:GTPase-associated system helical domain
VSEANTPPMRDEFLRWYRPVNVSANRELLEARWRGVVGLVETADAASVETMLAIALRTKPRPQPARVAKLRERFKAADDLFEMEGNDRELEVLSAAALATLYDSDNDASAHAALTATTASCFGARTADFPLDLAAAAEATICRISETRRKRPDLSKLVMERTTQIELDQASTNNLQQSFGHEAVLAALTAIARRAQAANTVLVRSFNAAVRSMDKFTSIQDEELQMLWWLFGGRSKTMDRPFTSIPEEAQPIVLAAEVAATTEFLPGPVSVKPILSRAGLKERKKFAIPAAVNACDPDLLVTFISGIDPSPITQPLHFAIKRKLETGDATAWVAGWSAITGIDSGYTLPAIELGNLFYRERLGLMFGA